MESIHLPNNYEPSENEEYMNLNQLEYFKQKLLSWKEQLLYESEETRKHIADENWNDPDLNDRALIEHEASIELKTRNRYLKLINKIDIALVKIDKKEYGFCDETGEQIGIKRLKARPIASLCIDAQQRHEDHEKSYIDDDSE